MGKLNKEAISTYIVICLCMSFHSFFQDCVGMHRLCLIDILTLLIY